MNNKDLPPSAVILDLVLAWSDTIGKVGTATIYSNTLIFAAKNHRDEYVMLSVPLSSEGPPQEGLNPRFVIFQLGPTVWKLSPSVKDDRIHGYLTIVGVPEPAPWL